MKMTLISLAVVLSLFSIPTAYAQGCLSIARDLSVGSRGSDVSALQSFLVAQNYPGSGSWMVTGYFGAATQTAVMNFQRSRGLPATGMVDAATRGAMNVCAQNIMPTFTNPYTYPYTYPYNYTTIPATGALSISSLSSYQGPVGSTVVIYGSGFDPVYNAVYFGNTQIPGNFSSNGSSITFTVPNYTNCGVIACYGAGTPVSAGTYQVYVTNTRGISNKMTFTVTGSGYAGCPFYGGFGCGYGNGSYLSTRVNLLSPSAGGVGTTVTVFGTGFTPRNNAVHFGNGIIANLSSFDGSSLTFTVPTQLTGFGSQTLTLGTYDVAVTNERGVRSNPLPFTVTSLAPNTLTPTIQGISGPTSIATGVQGVWTVTINTNANSNVSTTIRWGDDSIGVPNVSMQTMHVSGVQTQTFTHTYNQPGTYTIQVTVSNNAGLTNTATTQVTVIGSGSGTPTIASLSPVMGRSGTLVTISGSGFSNFGNTIRFGTGGSVNVSSSNNGTLIYYTIPPGVSPCDLVMPGQFCGAPSTTVTPGVYQISVSNTQGQSSPLYFTVTQ